MARKVYGTIKRAQGGPAAGLRVQALDEDDINNSDLMGEDITGGDGTYSITYRDGSWDGPRSRFHTFWRPDVFVRVQNKNAAGQWVTVWKSSTHSDHKVADDLKIDATVSIPADVAKTVAGFDRARFGYHFRNSFPVNLPLPGFNLSLGRMGFCGGMSAGALRNFNEGANAPNAVDTPVQGTALFNELLERQLRSLGGTVIPAILDWQTSPDLPHPNRSHSVGYRTKKQWPILRERLDADNPTVIVLIRSEGYTAPPTDNHQVLAFGYKWNDGTKDLEIDVYDPNVVSGTGKLRMNLGLEDIHATDTSGARLRGFFVNPEGDEAAGNS